MADQLVELPGLWGPHYFDPREVVAIVPDEPGYFDDSRMDEKGAATGCEVFLRGHTRGFEIGMTSREAMELLRGEKQGG